MAHDYCYAFGYALKWDSNTNKIIKVEITKAEADRLFAKISYDLEVNNITVTLMY